MRKFKPYYIYAHYTLDTNELFYIGVGNYKRAWVFRDRNVFWHNIYNKHGVKVEIIKDGYLDRDEAVNHEIMLQLLLKPRACVQYGDKKNAVVSKKTRDKMSASMKVTRESNPSPLLGRPISDEHKAAISAGKIGISQGPLTKEHKAKIGDWQRDRPTSNETKDKMRAAWVIRRNSPEEAISKAKASKKLWKAVVNCRGDEFLSMVTAANAFNISASGISSNIRGVTSYAGKYADGGKIVWQKALKDSKK